MEIEVIKQSSSQDEYQLSETLTMKMLRMFLYHFFLKLFNLKDL